MKRSLCIAHPCLGSGGSEATVLWSLVGLQEAWDVRLISGCPVDLERLNVHCGTRLLPEDFDAFVGPQLARRMVGHTDALRGAVFSRFLRSAAPRCDVCISGYNRMDFGKPGIQFIADLSFDDALRRAYDPMPAGAKQLMHRPGMLRGAYLGLARGIGGRSKYDGAEDWIIANSHWTADILRSRLGFASYRVIYPPVAGAAPDVPWERRADGFCVLGRVSYEKRIDRLIDILGRVRAQGHDVRLHVIGGVGDDAHGRLIRRKVEANTSWCFAEGAQFGAAKMALLAGNRYAIHGRTGEAFGIAVAEEVKAGCIPFVPSEGGPAEIVGTDELTYASEDEAVAKILAVLVDSTRQHQLRAHLARRAGMFSTERFLSDVRGLVTDWLERSR